MLRRNQAGLKLANMLSDLLIVLLSCFFAWRIRFDVLNGVNRVDASGGTLVMLTVLFGLVSILALHLFNIYSPQRLRKAGSNTVRIFAANGICSGILMAVLFVAKVIDVPRLAIGLGWFVSSLLISGKHIALHLFLHRMRMKGYNLRHYVVIGSGHLARQYALNIRENTFTGIQIDGYFGPKPGKGQAGRDAAGAEVPDEAGSVPGSAETDAAEGASRRTEPESADFAAESAGLGKYLGFYTEIAGVLDRCSYDGMVIAIEPGEISYMPEILRAADREGIQTEMIPFFNDYYPAFPTFETVGSSRLIDLRATSLNRPWNAMTKRAFDIVFSLLVLILLSPLLAAIAVGVKLSSPGPVIFRQERVGRNRKPFTMYKFRSMRVTGTEQTGWSRDRDPRKTRFGSFIRKCSLDELPQFFNVLKGDMSVVGPRPEIPFHVSHFKEEIPRYLVRQQVRPGITGWAQVNGFRGDTSITERVRYDIEYIENWTAGFDARILWRTVFGGMVNREKQG